ncbi:hypothetical protein E1289_34550 [Actinomadura sp. 6K520]|nr:hypothetical protein E1289_34550 [Actinomadura sp. 6K520]
MSIQFLTDPHGWLISASPALPCSAHDPTAARTHGIIDALTSCAITCHADKEYVGAGGAIGTPSYARASPPSKGGTSCGEQAAHHPGDHHRPSHPHTLHHQAK